MTLKEALRQRDEARGIAQLLRLELIERYPTHDTIRITKDVGWIYDRKMKKIDGFKTLVPGYLEVTLDTLARMLQGGE